MIVIKLLLAGAFAFTKVGLDVVVSVAVIAALLQISALRFALLHRPTRPEWSVRQGSAPTSGGKQQAAALTKPIS